jgi:hypothetical protein
MPFWTEDEARAYLPRLHVLLDALRRSTDLSKVARTNGHASMPGARPSPSPESPHAAPGAPEAPRVSGAEALEEIEDRGIVLRDVARGIVDFPSLHPSGREVHLCWRQGEDDLGFWHLPQDGFAGRRPLPLPPEI